MGEGLEETRWCARRALRVWKQTSAGVGGATGTFVSYQVMRTHKSIKPRQTSGNILAHVQFVDTRTKIMFNMCAHGEHDRHLGPLWLESARCSCSFRFPRRFRRCPRHNVFWNVLEILSTSHLRWHSSKQLLRDDLSAFTFGSHTLQFCNVFCLWIDGLPIIGSTRLRAWWGRESNESPWWVRLPLFR